MPDITIKQATPADLPLLQDIATRTFVDTFAHLNSAENMQAYITNSLSAEKLDSELRNPDSAFYFALLGDTVVGYLKLNFGAAQTERQDPEAVEIERIYVSKDHQGRQLGQLLFQKALDVARERHAGSIWLGVWEENRRAIGFYQKNGFELFDKHEFVLGNDRQTDWMMRRRL